jgi:hypothetical protein
MGHQIHAGDSGIHFTDGSWLIVNWCERETSDPLTDGGSTDIPAAVVGLANASVPFSFSLASAGGFLDGEYRSPIGVRTFHECRAFLRYAADRGESISGSF